MENSCLESTSANTRFDHTSLKVKGVDTCFKNTNLLCDQHPACDPGEDTEGVAWDEFGCLKEYKKKGLTPKDATYQCQSVHHNEESVKANLSLGIVMIEAVPCDGNPTCWNKRPEETLAPDERFCDNDLLTFWVPGNNLYSCFLFGMPFLRPSSCRQKWHLCSMSPSFSDRSNRCDLDNIALVVCLCTSVPKKPTKWHCQ